MSLSENDLIVSKTDLQSLITYANAEFCNYSCYTLDELLGQPHNLIRHEDMPRGVFQLMWEHLKREEEFFGYIKNRRKDGDYYWTLANVAPVMSNRECIGYISVRRQPKRTALNIIEPLYSRMLAVESRMNREQQAATSIQLMQQMFSREHESYAEFILSL